MPFQEMFSKLLKFSQPTAEPDPDRQMREVRTKFSEEEMKKTLSMGGLSLGPFKFELEAFQPPEGFDVRVRARSNERELERSFAGEFRTEWTRQALEQFSEKSNRVPKPLLPLLIFPYLSEEQLDELRTQQLSGLDLCGNGLIFDPPQLFVLRSGARKTFRIISGTPSIYQSRNVASLVARVFLTKPVFPTAKAVLEACHARMMPLEGRKPPLVLPTVSKALTRLAKDLVITRESREVRLRNSERLLTNLSRHFQPIIPPEADRFYGKTPHASATIWAKLRDLQPHVRAVVTGRGSARHYTALAGPERLQLYVSDMERVKAALQAEPNPAFPNIELIETQEEGPFFEAIEDGPIIYSSLVQTFLEMSDGTARERNASTQLRARILTRIERFTP